jgi:hypothetical protein
MLRKILKNCVSRDLINIVFDLFENGQKIFFREIQNIQKKVNLIGFAVQKSTFCATTRLKLTGVATNPYGSLLLVNIFEF